MRRKEKQVDGGFELLLGKFFLSTSSLKQVEPLRGNFCCHSLSDICSAPKSTEICAHNTRGGYDNN